MDDDKEGRQYEEENNKDAVMGDIEDDDEQSQEKD